MHTPEIDRRNLLLLAGLATVAVPSLARAVSAGTAQPAPFDLGQACRAVERDSGGRYGLAVHDLVSGRRFSWRGDERFAMASTFKLLLVAAILARVDRGTDRLDRAIPVKASDAIGVSPFTSSRAGGSAMVGELCRATMIFSDNGAANLLLLAVGGPAGLTSFLRGIGDPVTRLDRIEPMMSEDLPGEIRDTTSPDAMLATMERLLSGSVLMPKSRQQLIAWMVANTTGDTRLRAGLPKGWRVGDKTGSSGMGSANDLAIIWPTGATRPVFVASFINRTKGGYEAAGIHHARIAEAIAAAIRASKPV